MSKLYSKTYTCHSAAVADANGTAVDCSEMPGVAFQISGTLTSVILYFEGTMDGTNWVSVRAKNVATGALVTQATAAGVFVCDCVGLSQIRCRLDWTTGSVNVYARALSAAPSMGDALPTANSGVDIGDVTVNNAANAGVYVQPGTSTTWATAPATATTGGCTPYKNIDVDESEDAVKASAGTIYGGVAINLAATVRYLKLYNATVANVTVGTTVPTLTIPLPANSSSLGGGVVLPIPAQGVAFSTAITVAATTGVADNDSGAPGANEVVVNLWYA